MAAGSWLPWWLNGWGNIDLTGQADSVTTATGTLQISRNVSATVTEIELVVVSPTLARTALLSGASSEVELATGIITRTVYLAGQADGTATSTGPLQVTRPLTAPPVSSLETVSSAVLQVTNVLTGSVTGQETLSAALPLLITRSLIGQSSELEVTTGSLAVSRQFSGQASEPEAVTPGLVITNSLTGVAVSLEGASGGVLISRTLTLAIITSQELTTGSLTIGRSLSSQVDEVEGASGLLKVDVSITLSGQSQSISTVAPQLFISRQLPGRSDGQELVSSVLGYVGRALSGQSDSLELNPAQLKLSRTLNGQASSQPTVTGELVITRSLAGAGPVVEQGSVTGVLAVVRPLSAFSNGFELVVTAGAGGLDITRHLSVVASLLESITGGVYQTRFLAGQLQGQETATGPNPVTIGLACQVSEQSSGAGTILVSRNLTGNSSEVEVVGAVGGMFVARYLTGRANSIELINISLLLRPDFLPSATGLIIEVAKSGAAVELLPGAWATLTALPGAVTLIEALAKTTGGITVASAGNGKAQAMTIIAVTKATGQSGLVAKPVGSVARLPQAEAVTLIELLAKAGLTFDQPQPSKSQAAVTREVVGAGIAVTIEIGN
jgi:hypothetical protein